MRVTRVKTLSDDPVVRVPSRRHSRGVIVITLEDFSQTLTPRAAAHLAPDVRTLRNAATNRADSRYDQSAAAIAFPTSTVVA
ncbi:MAG TPA: hypothetical protein VFJ48_09130, partial [Casimicrobiaceae bacterium]|nr:hypothetical protein [Casimicrobiaceae bacterium]